MIGFFTAGVLITVPVFVVFRRRKSRKKEREIETKILE